MLFYLLVQFYRLWVHCRPSDTACFTSAQIIEWWMHLWLVVVVYDLWFPSVVLLEKDQLNIAAAELFKGLKVHVEINRD